MQVNIMDFFSNFYLLYLVCTVERTHEDPEEMLAAQISIIG